MAVVLVVDGDVLVRHAIADYLRHCGYSVIEAASQAEAMTVLGDASLHIETVLCDVGLDGFGLRKSLRDLRPDVDVILAGSVAAVAHAAADLCETGPHLARPYDPQGVVDQIKQMRARRDRHPA
jgi:DNA-binding NtrC family response regulator